MSTPDRHTTAAALREAADHVEAHPDLPPPYITSSASGRVFISYQLMNSAAKNQREAAAKVARSIGGKWDKGGYGDTFTMKQKVGLLNISILADRERVCARRVTGVETVTIPAVDAQPERVEDREIVEWDCGPVLRSVMA